MNGLDTARVLGYAGLIPFVIGSLGVVFEVGATAVISDALLAYGAVILSFLGGIVCGRAIGRSQEAMASEFITSVLPSLVGWAALIFGGMLGFAMCALGFGTMLWYDLREDLPPWFAQLRLHLSIGAIASCLIAAFFS